MPTARDRAPLFRRRLLPLTVFITAAVALLAFAGTAFAETKIGEASSPVNELINPQLDILNAKADYDTSTGTVTFSVTTRAAPTTSNPELVLEAALFTSSKPCSVSATQEPSFPVLSILVHYDDPVGQWASLESAGGPSSPEDAGPAATAISGGTITTSAATAKAAGRPYNCALVGTNENTLELLDAVAFPIAVAQQPAETVTTTTSSTTSQPVPASTPAPAPALLSLAKLKPLKLKVGKWATVKVKVTNTGSTATSPGSLQLKAAKGVIVKAGKQKLPVLPPGGSWTVSYKVKLTPKANKTSTLSLVGAAGTVTAKSPLVLKLAGG
jgi:hypothetical protein